MASSEDEHVPHAGAGAGTGEGIGGSSPAAAWDDRDPEVVRLSVPGCPVTRVTVYEDRAEATRDIDLGDLEPGTKDFVLTGLTGRLDPNSVRVKGFGAVTVLEVSCEAEVTREEEDFVLPALPGEERKGDDAEAEEKESTAERLRRELDREEDSLRAAEEELSRAEKERELLSHFASNSINALSGAADGKEPKQLGPEEFEKTAAFLERFSARSAALDTRINDLKKRRDVIKQRVSILRKRSSEERRGRSKSSHVVSVLARVGEGEDARLELSYLVSGASWTPEYDMRVWGDKQELQLTYYGAIKQSTGEDWRNCQVWLSTAKPSVAGSPPKLFVKRVSFGSGYRHQQLMSDVEEVSGRLELQQQSVVRAAMPRRAASRPPPAPAPHAQAKVSGTGSSATFVITRKATIESDNKPHRVTVRVLDLPSTFVYHISPSVSEHAYLKAITTNTSEFPLLPSSSVSVFLDNNFVAKTNLEHVNPTERFSSFLGTESSVKVKVLPTRQSTSTHGWLNKSNRRRCAFVTEVTNTRKDRAIVSLVQPLPVSSDSRIVVTMQKPGAADLTAGNRLHGYNLDGTRYVEGGAGAGEGAGDDEATDDSQAAETERLNQPHVWRDPTHNHVEWVRHLEPGETRRIPFVYDLEWPQKEGQIDMYSTQS